jgi:YbbR domain-containing protein
VKQSTAAVARRGDLSRGWTGNLGLKSFSLLASIVLFSLVHSEEEAERTFSVDVVALLPPPDYGEMLVSERPDQVKVTLRGSRSQINALDRDNLGPIQMDVADAESRYFHFDDADIEVPAGVQIVRIEPPSVKLTWAVRGNKKVAVKARLTGTPQKGLAVKYPVQIIPAEAALSGPETVLKSISSVYTDLVSLDGLGQGKHERRVPLEPLPDYVSYEGGKTVVVQMEIVPEVGERKLTRLEIASVGNGEAVFRPRRVAVTLRGPRYLLNDIDPENIVPYVDVSGLSSGTGAQTRKVMVRGLPESVEAVLVTPADVLARVR